VTASRTVLITGAASGIGLDCAGYLKDNGWRVLATDRTQEEADWLVEQGFEAFALDVADDDSAEAGGARVEELLDGEPLHGLVNNAAVAACGPLEYLPLEDVRRVFETNLLGPIRVTRALLPALRRGPGRVVFVSSSSAGFAAPLHVPYCASKSGLEAIAAGWRRELDEARVWVVVVAPGPVATRIWEPGAGYADSLQDLPDEAKERYADLLATFGRIWKGNRRRAIPPRRVTQDIVKALTARAPLLQYDSGLHAKLSRNVLHRLPTVVLDRLSRKL